MSYIERKQVSNLKRLNDLVCKSWELEKIVFNQEIALKFYKLAEYENVYLNNKYLKNLSELSEIQYQILILEKGITNE